MQRPLHPNLARIAAAYDEVTEEYRLGRLNAGEARRRVLALVARDDAGLEWSINPDTGQWQYRNQFGTMVSAEPPSYGVAGFTPGDLGSSRVTEDRVQLIEVDQSALRSPHALRGSTLLTGENGTGAPRRTPLLLVGIGAGLLLLGLAAGLLLI